MSDSDLSNAGVVQQAIRAVGAVLDKIFFGLLVVVFQIFFNVASAELFTGDSMLKFVGRVQLILGVFTIFQLAMSILKGIVNPDQFFSKDKGFSNVITKVVIALFLLAVIMPISIPGAQNEYEKQVNNNGILFGTLYSLQHRLLSNNTLGRLILGSNNSSATFMGDDDDELKSASNIFASTILKTFVKINLVAEEDRTHVDGKTDDQIASNWVCSDIDDYIDIYKQDDVDPNTLLSLVGDTCGSDDRGNIAQAISILTASDYFIFTYSPFLSAIVAGIFAFILLGFCIDVAIRAVKLSILRIIAPVPIISYMNPNGGKDGALNSWVKTLTSTYLDLFIRLATVYFAIFLIMDIIAEGIVINIGFTENALIGGVSTVLIFLGIFFFAKEAPKFFKDVLGLKGDTTMFGGIGKALGFASIGAGLVSGAITGWRGSNASQKANWEASEHDPSAEYKPNKGKQVASALLGGVLSGTAAGKAALNAKDHAGGAGLAASFKRNTAYAAAAEDGATLRGKTGAYFQRAFSGETTADKLSRQQKSFENRSKILSQIADRADSKAKTTKWTTGRAEYNGKVVEGNYQAWTHAKKAAEDSGLTSFAFNGQQYTLEEANNLDYGLMTANSADYIRHRGSQTGNDRDVIFDSYVADYESLEGVGAFNSNVHQTSDMSDTSARKYFKDKADEATTQADSVKRRLGVEKANSDATKP